MSMRNVQITVDSLHFFKKRVQEKDLIPVAISLHFTESFTKTPIWVTRFCGLLRSNSFKWFYSGPKFTSIPRNLTRMMEVAQEKQFLGNFSTSDLHNPLILTHGIDHFISLCFIVSYEKLRLIPVHSITRL